MRFVIHLLLALAVALGVGFGLSWFALNDGRALAALRVGPWEAWPQTGVPAPDPYTSAHLARTGMLQLGTSEGLQFIAATDSDGRALDRACTYRIDGETPVATFWTLVALDAQGINIARPGTPLALNSLRLARTNSGSSNIRVGKALSPGNWLEIAGTGPFTLALTLYDVASFSGVGSNEVVLPPIRREACS